MSSTEALGIHVAAGRDRFARDRKVFGVMAFGVKVSGSDTGGNLLVIEQANHYRGGPPRHLHLDQDEWFYVVEGAYVVEVAGVPHRLGPGDAILAPRGIPHGWALVEGPGRMVIAFQPAGSMEAFFDAASSLPGMPPHDEARSLFAAHGMRIEGPPLAME